MVYLGALFSLLIEDQCLIKVVESAIFDTFDSNIASLGFVILSDLVPFPFPSCNTGRWILYH